MGTSAQLAFAFGNAPAFGEHSFVVSGCNREAHAWISRWPEWMGYGLVISGAKSAGKTHLAHIWQRKAQALFLPPELLTDDFSLGALGTATRVIVDNADTAPSPRALLHLLNWLREQNGSLLLTGGNAAPAWPFALPDLRSRLAALPAAKLGAPDDGLLTALLTKLLADRQLSVSANVLDYVVRHMERSFAAASAIAARLDAQGMAHGRALTLSLAKQVLQESAAACEA